MSTKHKMPESLPADVGQAILALRTEMQAQIKANVEAVEQRIGQTLTGLLNGHGVDGQGPAGNAVDAEVRDYIKRTIIPKIKLLEQRTKRLEGLLGLPSDPDENATDLRLPGSSGLVRDEHGYVVDPMLPKIAFQLRRVGLTNEQFAALLGVDRRTVYRWMARKSAPSRTMRTKVLRWLNRAETATPDDIDEMRWEASRQLDVKADELRHKRTNSWDNL